jgi:hypothetical protein
MKTKKKLLKKTKRTMLKKIFPAINTPETEALGI